MITSRLRARARKASLLGRWRAAADLYDRIISHGRAFVDDHLQLAHACEEGGDGGRALKSYQAAAAAYPLRPEGHQALFVFLSRLGQTDAALDAAARAWVADPASVNFEAALEAAERNADAVDCHVQGGLAAGHPRPITDRRNIVARLDRRQRRRRARRLGGQGDWAGAERAWRALLSRRPNDVAARVQLGHVLGEQRRDEDALATYRTALLLQPLDSDIHRHVGHALKRLGRLDAAFGAYLAAWRLRPDDSIAAEMMALRPFITVELLRMDLAGSLLQSDASAIGAAHRQIPSALAQRYALHYQCLAGSIDAGH